MADISMCMNDFCDSRYQCYRYTAIPDKYQSYFLLEMMDSQNCEYFWDNKGCRNREDPDDRKKRKM